VNKFFVGLILESHKTTCTTITQERFCLSKKLYHNQLSNLNQVI